MRRTKLVFGLLASVFWASTANAHISVEQGGTHMSRYGDASANLKGAPCGVAGGARGTHIYTYEPGQTITVKWVEYVPHPGYFRFAFDADGDDGFKDPVSMTPLDPERGCPAKVLSGDAAGRDQCMKDDFYNAPSVLPDLDDLYPHVMVSAGTAYSQEVKLPDIECDNCTLQIIQVMEDPVHGPYNLTVDGTGDLGDIYHQCIDIVLKRGAGTADSDAGAESDADAGVAAVSAAGTGGAKASAGGGGASGSKAGGGAGGARAGAGGTGGGKASASAGSPAAGDSAGSTDSDSSGGCSITDRGRRTAGTGGMWLWALPVASLWHWRRRQRRARDAVRELS
jgi:hypothetical protein